MSVIEFENSSWFKCAAQELTPNIDPAVRGEIYIAKCGRR